MTAHGAVCHDRRVTTRSHRAASVARPAAPRRRAGVAVALMIALLGGCSAVDAPSILTPSAQASASAVASATPPMPSFPDGVTSVECDLATHARGADAAVTVLGDPTWRLGGWSHVTGVGSFASVAHPVATYRITAEHWTPDASCGGAKTLATVLVKKTYTWDQQHANGMEASFPTERMAFGDVTDIVLLLRLDPELTRIPTAEDLAAAYGDLLTPEELAQLDAGQVNLELTLFGEGATAEHPFMNAGTIISVDPAQAAAGWVRIQIPREQLTFYTEADYVRTEVGPGAWQDLLVQGLRINPETAQGATVRRLRPDDFDVHAKSEMFKEMALTFALIEVGRG